jgi:hypothetical protein
MGLLLGKMDNKRCVVHILLHSVLGVQSILALLKKYILFMVQKKHFLVDMFLVQMKEAYFYYLKFEFI